jgi:heparan-alpha-glucosaminide N-acetyltransferase
VTASQPDGETVHPRTGETSVSCNPPAPDPEDRVASVDALRGLVILLMIFVNDVAGVGAAPTWLKHVGIEADAMTVPDTVFPAFLFIAGMSIPLAMQRAATCHRSVLQRLSKVLTRTLALLVMGVLMVNMEEHNPGRGLWGLLAYAAMILAFSVTPRVPDPKRRVFLAARVIGLIGLCALTILYRTEDGKHLVLGPLWDPGDTVWLRHSWWGILGLIAWAYLTASLIYLVLGHRREWLIGATGLLAMLYVADHQGLFSRVDSRAWLAWAAPATGALHGLFDWVNSQVSVGASLGSLASLSLAGCSLGTILLPGSGIQTHGQRLRWTAVYVAGLACAAMLFDPLFGINKIRATPAWCFLCAAMTALAWAVLYWIMDARKHRAWSSIVRPAGANPLMAYLLHPMVFLIADQARVPLGFYKSQSLPVFVNVLGCLVMAVAVVSLTGLISRLGLRMRA